MKASIIQRPIYRQLYGKRQHVRGFSLDSAHFSSGKSQLKGGGEESAELTFHSSVISSVRDNPSRSKTAFAKLSLTLKRDKQTRQFSLEIPEGAEIEMTPTLDEKIEIDGSMVPRRCIFITTDDDFGNVRKPNEKALKLLLPDEAHQAIGHVEIHLALHVAGAEGANMDIGDILDIPLSPRLDSLVSFKLLDEKQEPLSGKTIKIKDPEGEVLEEKTDENGEVFFEADEGEEFEFLGVVQEELPDKDIVNAQIQNRGLLVEPRNS